MSTTADGDGATLEVLHGTHLVRTAVYRTPRGHRWQHRLADESTDDVLARADAISTARVTGVAEDVIAWGSYRDGAWEYQAPSGRTMAELGLAKALDEHASDLVAKVGEAVGELHSLDVAGPYARLPAFSPAVRLRHWLRGLATDFDASHFAPVARDVLGDDVWDRATRWCDELIAAEPQQVSHGRLGSGVVVLGEGQPAVVLAGPDLCVAAEAADIGYLVGELLEMWAGQFISESVLGVLVDGFSGGYGRSLRPSDYRAAVLRMLQHQHDYVCFARQVTPDVLRTLRFVRYFVESGAGDGDE